MRYLTIKRDNTLVNNTSIINLYIENDKLSDATINGVSCMKLGEIGSGEEKLFSIEEKALKIFGIEGDVNSNTTYEFYEIPEGKESFLLVGTNYHSPSYGSKFIFENKTLQIAKKRKKKFRRFLPFLIIIGVLDIAVSIIISVNLLTPTRPKTYKIDEMSITLTNKFHKRRVKGVTKAYRSSNLYVFTLKEEKDLLWKMRIYSFTDYQDAVLRNNRLQGYKIDGIEYYDDLVYFKYKYTNRNQTFIYYSFMYSSESNFWLVQFATLESLEEEMMSDIIEYALSVDF